MAQDIGGCSISDKRAELLCPDWSLRLFGRLHLDFLTLSRDNAEGVGQGNSFVDLRRIRFGVSGKIREALGYKLNVDFADSGTGLRDAFIAYKFNVGDGLTLKAGHFKVPYSLEQLTSSKYIPFVERHNTADDRMLAVGLEYRHPFGTAAIAVHGDEIDPDDRHNDYGVAGRLTATMSGEVHGQPYGAHIGFGGRYRALNGSRTDGLSSRTPFTSAVSAGRTYDVAISDADSQYRFNPDLAFSYGSLGGQAEYAQRVYKRAAGGPNARIRSWYIQARYWLTGERDAYDAKKGATGKVKPLRDVTSGGVGAWAVAFRYGRFLFSNVDGAEVAAERRDAHLTTFTAAVNWKPWSQVRLAAEYVRAMRSASLCGCESDDDPHGGQLRLYLEW